MQTKFAISIFIMGLAGFTLAAPPKVVSTLPDNGDDDVALTVKELRITFDQPMNPAGRSVVGGGDTFPEIAGDLRWADDHTFVIPVKLQPNAPYQLSINSDTFKGFGNTHGESAERYPISFHTRPAGAGPKKPNVTIDQNKHAFAELKKAIDRDYSHRDLKHIDWNKQIDAQHEKFEYAGTSNEFARLTAHLLRPAEDMHVSVQAGDLRLGTAANSSSPNFNFDSLSNIVPHWTQSQSGLVTGRFDQNGQNIGYILFSSCDQDQAKDFDSTLDQLKDTTGLIIDARANGGGDEDAAMRVAGRFVSKTAVYSRDRILQDGQWQGPFDRMVEPRKDADRYSKPVVVLIGPKVLSSAESFVAMMKYAGDAKLIGQPTKGSSGRPMPHDLGNGVTVFLPSWEDQLPDGTLIEDHGIQPDVLVNTTLNDFGRSDPVINAALQALK